MAPKAPSAAKRSAKPLSGGVDGPSVDALIAELRRGQGERLREQTLIVQFPFCEALGMRLLATGDGEALLATPYLPELVGDPETGVVHGGLITTLLDTACGVASALRKGGGAPQATLDLRIDYMRPAEPEHVIFAKARCYRRTRQISFLRATAFDLDEAAPIAVASAAFMNGGKVDQGEPGA